LLLESSGAPVCADDEIIVVDDDGREVAEGVSRRTADARPLHDPRLLQCARKESRGLHRRRLLPDGRHRSPEGRHVFTEGRRKDLINRGGEKISCEEVENLIYAHPKVKVATLVAMPRSGVR
jgi:2,3-dihydroxybenzoate-AMP ligase